MQLIKAAQGKSKGGDMSIEMVKERYGDDGCYYRTWEGDVDEVIVLDDCAEVYIGYMVITIVPGSGLPVPTLGDRIRFESQDERRELGGKITALEFV